MKAFQITAPKKTQKIQKRMHRVADDELLIRMKYIGLCGSDLKTYLGENPLVKFPIIPGHEIAGEVAEKGVNVNDSFIIGEKVTVYPFNNCGVCSACKRNRMSCCRSNKTLGVAQPGAAQEYILIHKSNAIPIKSMPLKHIVFIEPFTIGYHAVNTRGQVKAGDFVAIIGCGVIGLGAIFAAANKGANVIAVDIDDDKLKKAKSLGAKYSINSKISDVIKIIYDITQKQGADVIIEAVGSPDTCRVAIDLVCFAGRVVYIGYTDKEVKYHPKDFVYKELDILGSRNSTKNEMKDVIKNFGKYKIDLDTLITKEFNIEDIEGAFKYWESNKHAVTKILLKF